MEEGIATAVAGASMADVVCRAIDSVLEAKGMVNIAVRRTSGGVGMALDLVRTCPGT